LFNVFRMANSDISLIRMHRALHQLDHVVSAKSRDIASESRARLSVTFDFFSAILLVRAHRRVMSSRVGGRWDVRGRTIRHYESASVSNVTSSLTDLSRPCESWTLHVWPYV